MAPKGSLKRPAAAAAATDAGQKRQRQQKDCAVVAAALEKADLPLHVRQLVKSLAPHALSVCVEERHDYQKKAVDFIGEVLAGIETSLIDASKNADAAVASLDEEKARREQAVVAGAKDVAVKKGDAAMREAELVEAGTKADKATEALKARQNEAKAILASHARTAGVKESLEALMAQTLQPMREAAATAKAVGTLIKQVRELGITDNSLLEAVHHTFIKEPATRGDFDAEVLRNLDAALTARLQALEAELASMAPEKTQREQAVAEAEQIHGEVRGSQSMARTAVADAAAEVKAAHKALQEAEKALKNFGADSKRATEKMSAAKRELVAFTEGALATFKSLKERCLPVLPPVAEAAADKEPGEAEQSAAAPVETTA
eukprot:TRINITY_DN2841_c0_g1_i5.p1 TRINITY_DN2841_c0_g1~~TRINITY_DN2841_c0_g1_i5.p1  ORF type:complete len:377 (-),score=126.29 TRINITY_DN2841_c0_g1_i5:301-1431(-)